MRPPGAVVLRWSTGIGLLIWNRPRWTMLPAAFGHVLRVKEDLGPSAEIVSVATRMCLVPGQSAEHGRGRRRPALPRETVGQGGSGGRRPAVTPRMVGVVAGMAGVAQPFLRARDGAAPSTGGGSGQAGSDADSSARAFCTCLGRQDRDPRVGCGAHRSAGWPRSCSSARRSRTRRWRTGTIPAYRGQPSSSRRRSAGPVPAGRACRSSTTGDLGVRAGGMEVRYVSR